MKKLLNKLRQSIKYIPIYALALFFALTPISAPHAGDWNAGNEISVIRFCTDINPIMEVVKLYKNGKIEEGNNLFNESEVCYTAPFFLNGIVEDVMIRDIIPSTENKDENIHVVVLSVKMLDLETKPVVYLLAPTEWGPDGNS